MDRMEFNMHGATCLWNRNGVYYFRIRIPDDLKPHYPGKTEIRFSLKTSDKRDAIVRAAAERSKVLIEFSTKRKLRKKIATERNLVQEQIPVQTVDTEFIEYVCASRLRATLEQDDEFRPLFGPDWRSFVSPAERDREFLPRLKRALADGDTEWIRPVLEAHLHILGFTLQCGQEHYRPLAYRFMQTLVKEYEVMLSRDEGNSVETNVVASSKSLPKSALTLDDMFTSWSTATTRPTKTVKSFERTVTG